MAVPLNVDQRPHQDSPREESYLHFLLRESRVALQWIAILSLIATVALMMTFFFWAIVPAIALLVSYGLLLIANDLQQRVEIRDEKSGGLAARVVTLENQAAPPGEIAEPLWDEEKGPDAVVRRRLTWIGIEVVIGAALLALLAAAILFHWRIVAIAALVLFAYIIFVMTPIWLGWMEEDMNDEVKRQGR
jgi:hypothetical protein